MASVYGVEPQQMLKQFSQNPEILTSLSQQIINDKVRDFLVNNNNIEYVEITTDKEAVEA